MSLNNEETIKYFTLKDFSFEDGTVLPQVQLAYREFNPTTATSNQKIALIPTCFRGRINSTLNFSSGALQDYRVIVVALFGNGESSSPSNTPHFPRTLNYRDCVRAQCKLMNEQLGINTIDVIVGFSMGGQCAYHWAGMYPDMVRNVVAICSSAKTSLHNYQFLEGPRAALECSADYNDGNFGDSLPLRGLHAFGQSYSAWLTSADWFEERLFERQGYKSLQDWASVTAEKNYDDWHPDNLLIMLRMWQQSDVGVTIGRSGLNQSVPSVPLPEALRTLNARFLLMPCLTDQYFKWKASEKEAKLLKNAELAIIPSVWGHLAGSGANQEDTDWINSRIARFLK
ncbi:uncharacterized protein TRUGW13939_07697 [Talaromyces rugulosus]|uniref:AB hydrolase-1 domain-containing protein n=1 Tax=Talaromyces rugulosus TaxID=121627 RepID=A0A7H8R2J2_TALRU|nr:uncharacterized protein TRUGW13939_07697 [Talaromyces rugulosus]QKX60552.1 hypothetical protein TRUGW13939_07697 [Talaromyces rugulosus]